MENGGAEAYEEWSAHSARTSEYSELLRRESSYQHQGAGDTELYQYFLERCHQIVKPSGRVALLIRRPSLAPKVRRLFRRLLLETGEIEKWLDFENRRRVFPIHGMFRFAIIVWRGGRGKGIRQARFLLADVGETRSHGDDGVRLSLSFLTATSPERLSIPG